MKGVYEGEGEGGVWILTDKICEEIRAHKVLIQEKFCVTISYIMCISYIVLIN